MRDDDARSIGFCLKNRADKGIELSVHENNVLAVFESVEDDSSGRFDTPCNFDQQVDRFALCEHGRIIGKYRSSLLDCRFRVGRRRNSTPCDNPSFAICTFGMFDGSIGNRNQANTRNRRSKL